MVLMSAVTPAPEEGSNPAMVNTTGGAGAIRAIYRKRSLLQIPFDGVPSGQFPPSFWTRQITENTPGGRRSLFRLREYVRIACKSLIQKESNNFQVVGRQV